MLSAVSIQIKSVYKLQDSDFRAEPTPNLEFTRMKKPGTNN